MSTTPGFESQPAQPKKNWFARHKILTALLVVVVVIVIASQSGGDSSEGQASSAGTTAEGNASDVSADESASEVTAKIGDLVDANGMGVTVTSIDAGATVTGDLFTGEPQGQYVVVGLSVANNGDSGEYFSQSDVKLIDDSGRQHSVASESMWMDDAIDIEQINPGNSIEGSMLFDIPTDAVPTTLEVSSGWLSSPALISLTQ